MADVLDEINQREGSFNDFLETNVISVLEKSTADVIKTEKKYFKELINLLPVTAVAFGREIVWNISPTEHFVRDVALHIKVVAPVANTTISPLGLIYAIEYYKYELHKNTVVEVPGWALAQFLFTINTDERVRARMVDIIGFAVAGDFNTAGTSLDYFIPLIGPGTMGVYCDVNDNRQPAFPVGLMKDDMIIKVKFLAAADITGTTDMAFDSLTLRYWRFVVRGEVGNPTTSSGSSVVYSYNYPEIVATTIPEPMTAGANFTFNLNNVISQGDVQFIMLNVLNATEFAAERYAESSPITSLSVVLKGRRTIYSHSSQSEADWQHMVNFKSDPHLLITPTAAGNDAYYNIPISADYAWLPSSYGAAGVNFINIKPTITMLASETGTNHIRVGVVNKGVYNIFSDQTADLVTHFE